MRSHYLPRSNVEGTRHLWYHTRDVHDVAPKVVVPLITCVTKQWQAGGWVGVPGSGPISTHTLLEGTQSSTEPSCSTAKARSMHIHAFGLTLNDPCLILSQLPVLRDVRHAFMIANPLDCRHTSSQPRLMLTIRACTTIPDIKTCSDSNDVSHTDFPDRKLFIEASPAFIQSEYILV